MKPCHTNCLQMAEEEYEITAIQTKEKQEASNSKTNAKAIAAEVDKSDNLTDNTKVGKTKHFIKIVCVGDYSGGWSKGVYIEDYLSSDVKENPTNLPVIGFNLSFKLLHVEHVDEPIHLQLWNISEIERRESDKTIPYYKGSHGAVIFWSAMSDSIESAIKWKHRIMETLKCDIPIVLIVDNVFKTPVKWIGPKQVMNSKEEMDSFCTENGFTKWFEMLERVGGEGSTFGQAISILVEKIMSGKKCR